MKKILVVDDEKSIVKGIKFSLEQDDMKVEVAYDGETALELAKANHYDMIYWTSCCRDLADWKCVR